VTIDNPRSLKCLVNVEHLVKSSALVFRVLGLPYEKPVRLRGGINRFQDVHAFGVLIFLYNIYKLIGVVPKVERTNAILEQYCQVIRSFGDVMDLSMLSRRPL
jgi:hypothetical protein